MTTKTVYVSCPGRRTLYADDRSTSFTRTINGTEHDVCQYCGKIGHHKIMWRTNTGDKPIV